MGEPFFFPTATASSAPKVDDGLAIARFDDIKLITHDDWAGTDQYNNPDDGRRYHFQFTLLDDKHEEIFGDDGDPIVLEALTRLATGKRSNFRAIMESLLSTAEFQQFLSATPDNPFDGAAVRGRVYNVKVGHSASGWPNIADVVGVAKAPK